MHILTPAFKKQSLVEHECLESLGNELVLKFLKNKPYMVCSFPAIILVLIPDSNNKELVVVVHMATESAYCV